MAVIMLLPSLYIFLAIVLSVFFVWQDRRRPEPMGALFVVAIWGAVAALVAAKLNVLAIPASVENYLDIGQAQPSGLVLWGTAALVAVIEELLKFLPIACLLYRRSFFNELSDGIVYFGLAGMWFSVVESINYVLSDGNEVGWLRLIVMPFLHAGLTALAGWGLAMYKLDRRQRGWLLPAGSLGSAIVIHAIYNGFLLSHVTFLGIVSTTMSILVSVGLLGLYKFSKAQDRALKHQLPK